MLIFEINACSRLRNMYMCRHFLSFLTFSTKLSEHGGYFFRIEDIGSAVVTKQRVVLSKGTVHDPQIVEAFDIRERHNTTA